MPSRRPPLPICSGWPSSSRELLEQQDAARQDLDPARVELELLGDFGHGVAREHADGALQGLVLEHGAHQRAQRRRAAADGDRLLRLVDLDAFEEVADVVAKGPDLRRRRRIVLEEVLRQRPGADLERAHLAGAAGDGAEDDLAGAAADVDDAHGSLDGMAQGLGRADERQPALLLLGEDLDRESARRARSASTASSRFVDSRIAAVATIRIASAPSSSASRTWVVDDLGHLVDLLVVDRPVVLA